MATRTVPELPETEPTDRAYLDTRGHTCSSHLLLVLDPPAVEGEPLAYAWLGPDGALEVPGALRTTRDECDADALLLSCHRLLTLPSTLLRRVNDLVTPTTIPKRVRRGEGQTVSVAVYVVTASQEELAAIQLTNPSGTGTEAGLRPLKALGFADLAGVTKTEDRYGYGCGDEGPAASTEKLLLQTRLAFLDWSVSPGVDVTAFEAARQSLVAAVWDTTPIPPGRDVGQSTLVAAAARAPARTSMTDPSPRATVTTARTLQRAERLLSSAEMTRKSIQESYVNVGAPSMSELLAAQAVDPNCKAIRSYLVTGHAVALTGSDSLYHGKWIQREAALIRVYDGGLLYRMDPQTPKGPKDKRPHAPQRFSAPRLYIPNELRLAYLNAFHERFGHPGATRMFNVLRERYYWPGLHADVVSHVRECHECTLAKRLTRSLASPERSKLGSYPFDDLTVDIVTMGITHDGQYDKLLVFADSLSRWVEAVPFLGDPTSEQVMDAFLCHIACRYGWPRTIRSDGGSNLAGTLNKTLFSLTADWSRLRPRGSLPLPVTGHSRTGPRHPGSDGSRCE